MIYDTHSRGGSPPGRGVLGGSGVNTGTTANSPFRNTGGKGWYIALLLGARMFGATPEQLKQRGESLLATPDSGHQPSLAKRVNEWEHGAPARLVEKIAGRD